MQWLVEKIKNAVEAKFTGKIEINFFKGGITNVVVSESFKP